MMILRNGTPAEEHNNLTAKNRKGKRKEPQSILNHYSSSAKLCV
jgi:hypothetical protein